MTSVLEDIFQRVFSGDVGDMTRHCEDGSGRDNDVLATTDALGRSALLIAAMLGRSSMVRELVRHGGQVNEQTARGYSSLHLAACWGHVDTVRTLLDLDADTQAQTFRGERPVDVARRYSKTDCVDCLVLAEAKQELMSYLDFIRGLISQSERNISKEEKNICMRVCSDKSEWIQSIKNPSVSDFRAQRTDTEETLQPILSKLATHSVKDGRGMS